MDNIKLVLTSLLLTVCIVSLYIVIFFFITWIENMDNDAYSYKLILSTFFVFSYSSSYDLHIAELSVCWSFYFFKTMNIAEICTLVVSRIFSN